MKSPIVELRSVYELVGGVAHFGRMLDKIRLHAAGELPAVYVPFLGDGDPTYFDGRICRFLQVPYGDIVQRTLAGGSDEEILAWTYSTGRQPSAEAIEILTAFLSKRGWRDPASAGLREDEAAAGLPPDSVATFPDLMDVEEGRAARFPAELLTVPEAVKPTNLSEALRSPFDTVGGIVHFGRMVDKIRLFQQGRLPEAWVSALGLAKGFDGICCRFLHVDFVALSSQVANGGSDDELLAWVFAHGRQPSVEEILIWNSYLSKRGWRDIHTDRLHFRLTESGRPLNAARTMFDFIDLDEGRSLRFSW